MNPWMVVVILVVLVSLLPGCTAQQLQADEAKAYAALQKVEAGINWLNANADVVNTALDAAAAEAPNNPTLQSAVAKAKVLNTAGNRTAALQVVQGAQIVLKPAVTAPVTPAPPQDPPRDPGEWELH